MAELGPKNKHKVSAKSLANLRPNPHNLKYRGGSKRREYVTNQELEVLNNLLDGSNHRDAARRAGLSEGVNVTSLLLRPMIDRTFKELQEKRKNQSVEAAERRREVRAEFLHQELMHRLRTAVTHERTGDLGIAKTLEVGFKSTGEIRAQSVSATATAGAHANLTAEIDIYKPLWLREAEAKLLADAKKQYSQPVAQIEAGKGRKLSAERAKAYLKAAGGDKDNSRSRAQGWLGVLVAGPVRRTVQEIFSYEN
jgi:hypothetical protein